jgi:hypothetical protein
MIQLKKNKNQWFAGLIVALAMSASGAALAAEGAPAPDKGNHPCRALRKAAIEACSAAKFEKGKHKDHKGLFKDCVRPIVEGKSVEGVTVDATLVQACQAKKAAKGSKPQS